MHYLKMTLVASSMMVSGFYSSCSMASSNGMTDTSLFSDSKLTLSARNIFRTADADYYEDTYRDPQYYHTWVQGVTLDYESGFWNDIVGFDLSYDAVANLNTKTKNGYTDSMLPKDLDGFAKISQNNLKLKLGDDKNFVNGKAGWQRVSNMGIVHARNSRAIQKTYKGARLDFGYGELTGLAGIVDKTSDRNETDKRDFYTFFSRKPIDYIYTGELKWMRSPKEYITYFGGAAKDYLFRQGLETSFLTSLGGQEIKIENFFYHNKGLSNWEKVFFEKNAYHYGLRLSSKFDRLTLTGGTTYTDAPTKAANTSGFFFFNLAQNAVGRFASPAYNGIFDYMYDNETMIFSIASYQLTPEFTAGITGYYGSGLKFSDVSLHHWDSMLFMLYMPSAIKDLNIMFGPSYGQQWKINDDRSPDISSGSQQTGSKVGFSAQIDYKISVF
ncbi:MAG: OprD family outer membrane porin [Aeromonas veronii]